MSTILDALKKVETERPQSAREQLLHLTRPDRPRRPLSLIVVGAFGVLGFAAGIALALWRNAPPIEVASITPVDVAPPAIAVPPPPPIPGLAERVPPQQAGSAAPPPPAVEAEVAAPLAGAPVAVAGATEASASPGAAPDAVAAAPEGTAPDASGAAGSASAGAVVAPQPDQATRPPQTVAAAAQPPEVPANADAASALEPSPFARGVGGAAPPRARAPEPTRESMAAAAGRQPGDASGAGPERLAALPSNIAPDLALEPSLPLEAEPEPVATPEPLFDTGRSPPGAPKVALSFLQYSADPARRFAFVSLDGAPSQRVREGDTAGGMTVAQITPTGVQFNRDGKIFLIRPRH